MRIIAVGYPGSQELVPFSKYLIEKYIGLETIFLNHLGDVDNWSSFVSRELEKLDDERIIFTLDDYLVRGLDKVSFERALTLKPCVKLCYCTEDEHKEYPVTTQYTIWDRKELIELLKKTTNPWDFEINGSKLFKDSVVCSCIDYDTRSALSKQWKGVRMEGSENDFYGQR